MGWFDKLLGKKPGGEKPSGDDASKKGLDDKLSASRAIELAERFSHDFVILPVPGAQAEGMLRTMRRILEASATCPVLLGDYNKAAQLAVRWGETFDFKAELQRARDIDVEDWFEMQRRVDAEINAEAVWGQVHSTKATANRRLSIGFDPRDKPIEEVFIAHIPTRDPTMIPLYLRFGGWNGCPPPAVHTAVARHWKDKYGAEIATVSSDVMEFFVAEPPTTDAQALDLAFEQYHYCNEIVDQGVGSIATLAESLRRSTHWYFWWD